MSVRKVPPQLGQLFGEWPLLRRSARARIPIARVWQIALDPVQMRVDPRRLRA